MNLQTKSNISEYISPDKLAKAEKYTRNKIDIQPFVAVTLGSGLGNFAERIENQQILPVQEIPHYPSPTVEGHDGQLIFGEINSVPVLGIKGRSHYYEGRALDEIVFYVELIHKLGVPYFILTNAAGGVDPRLTPGDLVLLNGYMNFTQIERSFLDSNRNPFSEGLNNLARNVAKKQNIDLHEGVYCWTTGPSFETIQEVQACRQLGVSVVGMSTVPELQRAAALNMKTLAVSLVTNMAAGISKTDLSHEEVQETADRSKQKYSDFIAGLIGTIQEKKS
ncbi:MAG TPA: purine-nucleoside phosphorylase [bacterium]|nr:purine-nucleoside phosphorylase [bacterium]